MKYGNLEKVSQGLRVTGRAYVFGGGIGGSVGVIALVVGFAASDSRDETVRVFFGCIILACGVGLLVSGVLLAAFGEAVAALGHIAEATRETAKALQDLR